MKLLEPHITSGLGVALKADNGMYLTIKVNDEVFQHIYADKSHKDFYTKFIVEKVDNRTIRLRNNLTKSYLSKDFGIFANQSYIVALKRVADENCNFRVFDVDGKLALRNVENGKFLSRSTKYIILNPGRKVYQMETILPDVSKLS